MDKVPSVRHGFQTLPLELKSDIRADMPFLGRLLLDTIKGGLPFGSLANFPLSHSQLEHSFSLVLASLLFLSFT
jgi:hypothetical protein